MWQMIDSMEQLPYDVATALGIRHPSRCTWGHPIAKPHHAPAANHQQTAVIPMMLRGSEIGHG